METGGDLKSHALISMNIGAALVNAFRDPLCPVCGPDMRRHIAALDKFRYPDAMALCGTGEHHDRYVEAPSLIGFIP
jgi:hypothetical protein